MRFAGIVGAVFGASLLLAGAVAAQTPAASQPPQAPPAQSSGNEQTNQAMHHQWPMRAGLLRPTPLVIQGRRERQEGWGGPLHVFSQMEGELDNPRVQTALGLSSQQVTSLRGILVRTEIDTIQTGAGMLVDGIQLKELLRSDHPDRTAVMAKGSAISQSVSHLVDHYLDAILQAKTILTPQQQDMIRAYMEKHRQGFGGPGFPMNPEH